jgi:uncharacterized protein
LTALFNQDKTVFMNPIVDKGNDSRWEPKTLCTAFDGHRCVASGLLPEVVRKAKEVIDRGEPVSIVIFDDEASELIEVDFRGSVDEVLERLGRLGNAGVEGTGLDVSEKRGPGRPRLGVVGREVTLLPRHWEWLDGQPGGASVALRKLIEAAKRASHGKDRARKSQEAVHRFMYAMAGDLPGFEEATRAFYRMNYERFNEIAESWPQDVRDHVRKLVAVAIRDQAAATEQLQK